MKALRKALREVSKVNFRSLIVKVDTGIDQKAQSLLDRFTWNAAHTSRRIFHHVYEITSYMDVHVASILSTSKKRNAGV